MKSTDCFASESKLTSLDEAVAAARATASTICSNVSLETLYAAGRVLAADIFSPLPLPPFDQSAMDGYSAVVTDEGTQEGAKFLLKGRLAAGDDGSGQSKLERGEAYRVFTGAPLPPGANAVVMQEHCAATNGSVVFNVHVRPGDNIRRIGEDIQAQQLILTAGTKLDPRHVAVLSAMGLAKVTVKRKLRVGLFTTGSELVEPGAPLRPGQIYDANKAMLMAALKRPGLEVEDYGRVGDDLTAIKAKLDQCAPAVDLILTTGSAGGSDTDLLLEGVRAVGGEAQLFKLALKPGKPCIMGRHGKAVFLGLPGNPVATLVTFLMFGEAMIAEMLGAANGLQAYMTVEASNRYRHVQGKTEFVPAHVSGVNAGRTTIDIVGKGGSARFLPLLIADGLAIIGPEQGHVEPGELLRFLPFRTLSWT